MEKHWDMSPASVLISITPTRTPIPTPPSPQAGPDERMHGGLSPFNTLVWPG